MPTVTELWSTYRLFLTSNNKQTKHPFPLNWKQYFEILLKDESRVIFRSASPNTGDGEQVWPGSRQDYMHRGVIFVSGIRKCVCPIMNSGHMQTIFPVSDKNQQIKVSVLTITLHPGAFHFRLQRAYCLLQVKDLFLFISALKFQLTNLRI